MAGKGRAALAALALLQGACVGGRVGYRWSFHDDIPPGPYGGPVTYTALDGNDGLAYGGELSVLAASGGPIVVMGPAGFTVPDLRGSSLGMMVGLGIAVGGGHTAVHASVCAMRYSLVDVGLCARSSLGQWLGVDAVSAVNLIAFNALSHMGRD